jgi:hypothetical protein
VDAAKEPLRRLKVKRMAQLLPPQVRRFLPPLLELVA